MHKIFPFLFFSLLLLSCSKDDSSASDLSRQNELEENNYIKAFFNAEEVFFNETLSHGDLYFNSYVASEQKLRMQRVDSLSEAHIIDMEIKRFNLDATLVPSTYTYTHDTLNSPSITVYYYDTLGTTYSNKYVNPYAFQFTIDSRNEDLLIGSFEGNIYSAAGDSIEIINGLYRIKIERFQ